MASKAFGIDFGTSTIKIYKRGHGIVLDERNIIAIANKKNVIASGNEAYDMYEKAPSNILVTYPVRNGVIADVANMMALLNHFMQRIHNSKHFGAADYYVAVPTDITEVERRSFYDLIASSNLKTGRIKIVEKAIADAIGAGLEVMTARGVMIVDIGADTTEVSILSLGGIVLSKLIPVGGNRLDESIKNMVKRKYNLYIGDKTAESIKKKLASSIPTVQASIKVYGRDVVTGLPSEMDVSSDNVYEAISEYMYSIIDAVKIILERTPPEISSDIIDSGIYVTGGSAQIFDLDQFMHKETDLKINICSEPANTVVNGLGKIMEDNKLSSLADTLKSKVLS
ncbi:rod shape-determining protein [Lachnospiraceae bacterium MD1]|uniref:Cell shape-determining protein MreB n=1 Tax=Variimorphobacter saccharofermentans TaxID=2755051 RepID=A0A839K031_9FIRM|nr:rod shape-determining protein [Variimorphobacter saccharofermentans]MBB2182986.1 rod shape-determining protein [Variimorphobacter saccharofermentans]